MFSEIVGVNKVELQRQEDDELSQAYFLFLFLFTKS